MKTQILTPTYNGFELVQNRTLLANRIGFRPRYMAYADVKRERLQIRKDIADGESGKVRTVYRSVSPLCFIQQRLGTALSQAFDALPGTEPAIACRKGLDVRKLLAEKCTRCAVLVKTDIRKYYDHVTRRKLNECLKSVGFVDDGPDVVSRFLLVGREVEVDKDGAKEVRRLQTLQQGSAASPAAANIVGKVMFDDPIVEWLEKNMGAPYQYYRYSDNITLVLGEDPGKEAIEAYKRFVKDVAERGRYSTHSWSVVRPNNKVLAQKFLGVVLNDVANIERRMRDWVRAILYTAITKGVRDAAYRYCDLFGISKGDMAPEEIVGRFMASIRGYAEYVRSVNPKHGARLVKLCHALEAVERRGKAFDMSKKSILKEFKNDSEPIKTYARRIEAAIR